MIVAFPHVETFQYFFDDMLLLDKSNDFHFALTFGAYERIYFVDFLNQARPVFSECLARKIRMDDAWDIIILAGFFA